MVEMKNVILAIERTSILSLAILFGIKAIPRVDAVSTPDTSLSQCQFLPKATIEHINTYLGNRQAEVLNLGDTLPDPNSCFITEAGRITISTDPNIASGLGGSIWPASLETINHNILPGSCERIRSLALPSQTVCTFPK